VGHHVDEGEAVIQQDLFAATLQLQLFGKILHQVHVQLQAVGQRRCRQKRQGHQLVDAGIDGLRRLKIVQDNSLVKVTQPPHEGLLLVGGQVATVKQLWIPMVVHAGVAQPFPQLFRQPPLLLVTVEPRRADPWEGWGQGCRWEKSGETRQWPD
jgi:hypothetical protein